MYVAMYLLEDWQSSPQPCGCTIERQDDSPKEAIASLCLMHVCPCHVRLPASDRGNPLQGPAAISAATDLLARMEGSRLTLQILRERQARREQREARKQQKKRDSKS
jgi:hypothetical protein